MAKLTRKKPVKKKPPLKKKVLTRKKNAASNRSKGCAGKPRPGGKGKIRNPSGKGQENRKDFTGYTLDQIMEVAYKAYGNIKYMAESLKVSRLTIYNWIESSPEFDYAVKDAKEDRLDFAENVLQQNVEDKKEASTFFYLKTIGRKRGFIEMQHIKNVTNPYEEMKEDELQSRIKEQQDRLKKLA